MAVLRRLQADLADQTDGKEPPPPTELNVAIYGSPSKRWLGKLADLPVPVTPYDIIIVKAEYDGLADFPDSTSNLLAVTNAILGGVQLHVNKSNFDIRNIPTKYTVETNQERRRNDDNHLDSDGGPSDPEADGGVALQPGADRPHGRQAPPQDRLGLRSAGHADGDSAQSDRSTGNRGDRHRCPTALSRVGERIVRTGRGRAAQADHPNHGGDTGGPDRRAAERDGH